MIDRIFDKFADQLDRQDEFEQQSKSAHFPRSGAAGFMQVVGALFIALGIFGILSGEFSSGIGVALLGAFVICTAALQQTIFDIRTILLRQAAGKQQEHL